MIKFNNKLDNIFQIQKEEEEKTGKQENRKKQETGKKKENKSTLSFSLRLSVWNWWKETHILPKYRRDTAVRGQGGGEGQHDINY